MELIKLVDYGNLEDWAITAKEWVDDRVSSVDKALEDKIKVTLGDYLTKTGKWDLESMKLDLIEYRTERANRAMAI